MTSPNLNEIFEQSMKQMQANAEETMRAGETWAKLWTEQTRANLELLTAWQKQSGELLSSFASRGAEIGAQERGRFEELSRAWQAQWQANVEQGTEMARGFGEAAEEMLHKGQAQMAEMSERMVGLAGMGKPSKPAAAKKS